MNNLREDVITHGNTRIFYRVIKDKNDVLKLMGCEFNMIEYMDYVPEELKKSLQVKLRG